MDGDLMMSVVCHSQSNMLLGFFTKHKFVTSKQSYNWLSS